MKNTLKNFEFHKINAASIQMACLVLVACFDTLNMVFGIYIYQDFQRIMILWLNLIAMVYLGVTIREPMTRLARNTLLLGMAFCAWPVFMQLRDVIFVINPEHPEGRFLEGTFLCEYLLLLPFACVADEKEKVTGLKVFGWFMILASGILTVWGLPFGDPLIPESLRNTYRWNGSRMCIIWNANMLAASYMAGIAFCMMFICQIRKLWVRILLAVLAVMGFMAMILTDCRTVLMLTGCLLGGTAFVLISRGGMKRALLGLLAAGVVVICCHQLSGYVYGIHVDRMIAATRQEMIEEVKSGENAEDPAENAEQPDTEQNPLGEDAENSRPSADTAGKSPLEILVEDEQEYRNSPEHFLEFGGRMKIWKNALQVIKDNPRLFLFGMRRVDNCIQHGYGWAKDPHNAMLNILMRLGLIGLGFAVYFTWLTIKNAYSLIFLKKSFVYQKIISILLVAIVLAEIFEPQLYFVMFPDNFTNMTYLFCLGYTIYWEKNAQPLKEKKKETVQ